MAKNICVLEAEADLDTYQTDSSAGSIADVFCRLTSQKNEPFKHGLLLEWDYFWKASKQKQVEEAMPIWRILKTSTS